jgi:hypothetical protein
LWLTSLWLTSLWLTSLWLTSLWLTFLWLADIQLLNYDMIDALLAYILRTERTHGEAALVGPRSDLIVCSLSDMHCIPVVCKTQYQNGPVVGYFVLPEPINPP